MTSDNAERLVWMAACVGAIVLAVRCDGLLRATAFGAVAGYCFKRAA